MSREGLEILFLAQYRYSTGQSQHCEQLSSFILAYLRKLLLPCDSTSTRYRVGWRCRMEHCLVSNWSESWAAETSSYVKFVWFLLKTSVKFLQIDPRPDSCNLFIRISTFTLFGVSLTIFCGLIKISSWNQTSRATTTDLSTGSHNFYTFDPIAFLIIMASAARLPNFGLMPARFVGQHRQPNTGMWQIFDFLPDISSYGEVGELIPQEVTRFYI